MGTLTALQLYAGAAEVLEDITYVTYLETSFLNWINDAQRAVVLADPTANGKIQTISLTPGVSLQTLPATVSSLGGLSINMGVDGLTPGKAIRGPVPQETLDSLVPDWQTTPGTYVREYVYDPAFQENFYVYPPVTGAWYVQARVFATPTDLTASSDPINLTDQYAPAIIEWLLCRCYSRDAERTPNFGRANRHFANFFQLLGVKIKSEMATDPKVLEFTRPAR